MYGINQRILRIFGCLSLLTVTACGKDGPTELSPQEPPPAPVPSLIVISPVSVTLDAIGQDAALAASVYDQNNAVMSSAIVIWASGDDVIATVNTTGQVTAVGNGITTITATSGNASATVNLPVMQMVHVIAIEPQMAILSAIGETVQFTATVLDRNKQPVASVAVAWTSTDAGVATVDDQGLVTAVNSGAARITASHGGFAATAQVEVDIANPDRGTSVSLYNTLDGSNWTNPTYWLSDMPMDAWYGVQTDEDEELLN